MSIYDTIIIKYPYEVMKIGYHIYILDASNERKCRRIRNIFKPGLLLIFLLGAVTATALTFRESPEPASSPAFSEQSIYTLRWEDGKVDVYSGGRVVSSADIDLSLLREADRDMLKRGVSVMTREEALGLLEDFSS